jgi:hypothetical protein
VIYGEFWIAGAALRLIRPAQSLFQWAASHYFVLVPLRCSGSGLVVRVSNPRSGDRSY